MKVQEREMEENQMRKKRKTRGNNNNVNNEKEEGNPFNNNNNNNNNKMHPKNRYQNGYSFETFNSKSLIYPYLIKRDTFSFIDWKNYDAVKAFNISLLKRDFDLNVHIEPTGRLVPSIPSRLNYILWISDLIDATKQTLTNFNYVDKIIGIDIGTGASCIYPLLGTSMNKNWQFYATEIDIDSYNNASKNVAINNLNSKIKLIKGCHNKFFQPVFDNSNDDNSNNNNNNNNTRLQKEKVMFTMCNPPYFSTMEEWEAGKSGDMFGGEPVEMITNGGEETFIINMINESIKYKDQIIWFTTLIGIKKHIHSIEKKLRSLSPPNHVMAIKHHTFRQGRTFRWGIAWSFFKNIIEKEIVDVRMNIKNYLHNINDDKTISDYLNQCMVEFLDYCSHHHHNNNNDDYRIEKSLEGIDNLFIVFVNRNALFKIKLNIDGDYIIFKLMETTTSNNNVVDEKHENNNNKFHFFKIVDKMKSCITQSRKWKRRKKK